jgi:hypothetical protein
VKRIALLIAQWACGVLTGGRHDPIIDAVLGRICKRCGKKLPP